MSSTSCIRVASLVLVLLAIFGAQSLVLSAEECRLQKADGLPSPDQCAPAIANELTASHVALSLDDEPFCELWLAKTWKRRASDKPIANDSTILYSLEPGSLVGVVRLAHACYDLRDQEIPAGVYTLRYAVQPDIEPHKESHDSRDFLLMVGATVDKSPQTFADPEKLIDTSAHGIGTMHPAFLPLLKPKLDTAPQVRRDERDPNGWVLRIGGKDTAGKDLPMEIILLHARLGG